MKTLKIWTSGSKIQWYQKEKQGKEEGGWGENPLPLRMPMISPLQVFDDKDIDI